MSKSIHQKIAYKTDDKSYPALPAERDTLASQPAPGAYDATALLRLGQYPHDVAGGVLSKDGKHPGESPSRSPLFYFQRGNHETQ